MKTLRHPLWIAAALLCGSVLPAGADEIIRDITGDSPAGQPVALRLTIDFTPTGGSYLAGTGTATVQFTLLNTSSVFPYQSPKTGNPLLTALLFNLPPGTGAVYTETRILAGATLSSAGTTVGNVNIPPGCHVIAADSIVTGWYLLDLKQGAGSFGTFTDQIEAAAGNKPALAAPGLFVGCVPQGDFYLPLVIAGTLRHTIQLDHLGPDLSSAAGFLTVCTGVQGTHQSGSLGGKFQGTDTNGLGSAYVAVPCGSGAGLPVLEPGWGALRIRYR